MTLSRELALPLKKPASKINLVRLVMEQTDNWYYSEFEAVKLIQHKTSNNTANPLRVQLPSRQSSVEPPANYVEPPPSYSR